MNLKISVVVPIYNVEPYLNQCVKSILDQTYTNLEIILVDDGSPDNCPQICDDYAKIDERIKVVHKKNGGLSSARNAGIEFATGDYIVFMDSDDFWDDNMAIQKCIDVCSNQMPDVLLFGFKKFYEISQKSILVRMNLPQHKYGEFVNRRILLERNAFVTSAWNKMVKRSLFTNNSKIRFVENQLSEDIEYCALLLLYAQTYIAIDEYFYVYRQRKRGSITSNLGVKNLSDITGVIQRYSIVANEYKGEKREALLNYMALQYVLWMTNSNKLPKKNIDSYLKEMKALWWLLDYTWCPYVKKIVIFKFLGFEILRKLLYLYFKLK